MIILHDSPSMDLSHISAMAEMDEGFALFDYVRIMQPDGKAWVAQIVQPNQNISTIGDRLDPTVRHGLELMRNHPNVQSVESVQIFDLLVLGLEELGHMQTPRIRPLPGSTVEKLDAEAVNRLINLPAAVQHADGSCNCIGELLNADNVPLCITPEKFNYHIMVTGGTGAGKSNAVSNLVDQATRYGMCVLVHDAKPDYGLVHLANTDKRVDPIWPRFSKYGLGPHKASQVVRVGFYNGKSVAQPGVDVVVGFTAADFTPGALASLFFPGNSQPDQNAHLAFSTCAAKFYYEKRERVIRDYTVQDILNEVAKRNEKRRHPDVRSEDTINEFTATNIGRKVKARMQYLPWLDVVGQSLSQRATDRLSSSLDRGHTQQVERFNLEAIVEAGKLIVVDYGQIDDDESYALLLSYFLRTGQNYRKRRGPVGLVQVVDEAHRIFDNRSRHSETLASTFERIMREGRSVDHSIILSLQNASQVPHRVLNNLNSKIVMKQNSKEEADAATQTMGREFAPQSMRLGAGHALVSMYESGATVLVQMAPSPYELQRTDNTRKTPSLWNQSGMEDDFDLE